MSELKTIGKISSKHYKCRECGMLLTIETNHWGAIYPHCTGCKSISIFDCLDEMPEGYKKPKEWKIRTLAEICNIS